MREILFRGRKENGEWAEGDFAHPSNIVYSKYGYDEILKRYDNIYCDDAVIPETIGQFTGLFDKNGNKIFEGDIIKYISSEGKEKFLKAGFANGCFIYEEKSNCGEIYTGVLSTVLSLGVEVAGNAYDNPELSEV